jgi:hypothetical protein
MSPRLTRRVSAWLTGGLALLLLAACQRTGQSADEARVGQAFDAWKNAVVNHQADAAIAYIPRNVEDYLSVLKEPGSAPDPTAVQCPGVNLLLTRALQEKVAPDLRGQLTLSTLIQRITDRHLLNPHDLLGVTLGSISVDGDHASAEIYYDDTLTAIRLPFLKEDDTWKIDVLSLLPYAETLMRLDRSLKGESEDHQVDELLAKVPSL